MVTHIFYDVHIHTGLFNRGDLISLADQLISNQICMRYGRFGRVILAVTRRIGERGSILSIRWKHSSNRSFSWIANSTIVLLFLVRSAGLESRGKQSSPTRVRQWCVNVIINTAFPANARGIWGPQLVWPNRSPYISSCYFLHFQYLYMTFFGLITLR